MEYVYKLRIKTLKDLFKPGALAHFDKLCNSSGWAYKRFDGKLIFKERKFGNYDLDSAMLFYKNQGHKGDIHLDSDVLKHVWGINWVVSGTGSIDFWRPESIDGISKIVDRNNVEKSIYEVTKPPDKTYIMMPGVYLVYAGVPHRANGYGRMVLSVRMNSDFEKPWENVVEDFLPYILS
jgi:hypothetical protein